MSKPTRSQPAGQRRPRLERHARDCRVCSHAERAEIEREWVGWGNTDRIAGAHGLSRDSLYRHAHAVGLFDRRAANLRKALEHIIEQAESVEVNASAVVSAIQAYAKINTRGQWVDRVERVNLTQLFQRMSREELETYAREGRLPTWFSQVVGGQPAATPAEAPEEGNGSEIN